MHVGFVGAYSHADSCFSSTRSRSRSRTIYLYSTLKKTSCAHPQPSDCEQEFQRHAAGTIWAHSHPSIHTMTYTIMPMVSVTGSGHSPSHNICLSTSDISDSFLCQRWSLAPLTACTSIFSNLLLMMEKITFGIKIILLQYVYNTSRTRHSVHYVQFIFRKATQKICVTSLT